ncbi:hypothetical protein ARSEF1564_005233 [Beauveria bassiana]
MEPILVTKNDSIHFCMCSGQICHVRTGFAAAYHHYHFATIELLSGLELRRMHDLLHGANPADMRDARLHV